MVTKKRNLTAEQKVRAYEKRREWAKANAERVREYNRKWYNSNKEYADRLSRDAYYKLKYGITVADYEAMLTKQNGCCCICGKDRASPSGRHKHFSVDHCHATGRVRGLLCTGCNAKLGWFELHTKAIEEYLIEPATTT